MEISARTHTLLGTGHSNYNLWPISCAFFFFYRLAGLVACARCSHTVVLSSSYFISFVQFFRVVLLFTSISQHIVQSKWCKTQNAKKKKRKLSPMFSATTVLIAQCSAGEESTRTKTDMFSLVACARAIAHNTCISRMACCQLSPKTSVCRLSLFYFIARSFFSLLDSFSSLRRRRGRRCLCLSRGIQQMCAEQDSFDIVFLLRPHTGVLFSAGQ